MVEPIERRLVPAGRPVPQTGRRLHGRVGLGLGRLVDLVGLVVLVEVPVVGRVGRVLGREVLQVLGVPPGTAKAAVGERDQNSDREHERITLGFGRGDFDECADSGIGSLDKVAAGARRVSESGGTQGGEAARTPGPRRGCGGRRGGI